MSIANVNCGDMALVIEVIIFAVMNLMFSTVLNLSSHDTAVTIVVIVMA